MATTKRSSGSVSSVPKRPRTLSRPEEHEDLLTDKSQIAYCVLTPLVPAHTWSSHSITVAQTARKGPPHSSETHTGRRSSRNVEFHLLGEHTDIVEAQEHSQAIEVSEVEEIVDTSHSEYDDSPVNKPKSFEGNEDELKDEPQASKYKSHTVREGPRTALFSIGKVLGDACRKATGGVAEVFEGNRQCGSSAKGYNSG